MVSNPRIQEFKHLTSNNPN